jgi:hypothetical protein
MLVKKSKPYPAGEFVRFLRAYSNSSEIGSPCDDCDITLTCGEDRLKFCRKVNKYSQDIIYLPKAGNERNKNYLDL